MDTISYYRCVQAVRDTLDRAGRPPHSLFRVSSSDDWIDLGLLQDYLDSLEADRLPIVWDGVPLLPHDEYWIYSATLKRRSRSGEITLHDGALVAHLRALAADGSAEEWIVLGEAAPGAAQRFLYAFDAHTKEGVRRSEWIHVIGGTPLPRPKDRGWDELVLEPSLRDDFRRQVGSFFEMKAEYARLNVPHRRGLLLTGPPGNGKTTALRIVAAQREEPFFIYSGRQGSERYQMDKAFDRASKHAPSILCFEDVDSLLEQEAGISTFLNRLDGLRPLEGVLILATTNHPEKLDAAITERPSRFDRIFTFGPPAAEERRRYLRSGLGAGFVEALVDETDGFSMAQLKEVRVSACLDAVHARMPGPTADGARRAIGRLKGQKQEVSRDWESTRPIGFQWTRVSDAKETL